MERHKKIQKRTKFIKNIDIYKIEERKREKKKSKNSKYNREIKFNQNYNNIDTHLCNCKWGYKYNFHEDNCKLKDVTITNKNVINKEKSKYMNVLFNEDLFCIIMKHIVITDLVSILKSCKTLYNFVEKNIALIINNLTTKYTINQHFIILVLNHCYSLDLYEFYKCYNELMYLKKCNHRNYFYKYYRSGKKKLISTEFKCGSLKHCERYKRGILEKDSNKDVKCSNLIKSKLSSNKLKICYCQNSNFNYNYSLKIKMLVRNQIMKNSEKEYYYAKPYKGIFNIYDYYSNSNYSDFNEYDMYNIYDPDGPYPNNPY